MGIIDGGDGRGHSLIGAFRARRRSKAPAKDAAAKDKDDADAPADDAPSPVTDEGGASADSAAADTTPAPTIPSAAVATAAPPAPAAPPAATTRAMPPPTRAMDDYVGQVEDRELSSVSSLSPSSELPSSPSVAATKEAVRLASLAVAADGAAVGARSKADAAEHARDAYKCTSVTGLLKEGWRGGPPRDAAGCCVCVRVRHTPLSVGGPLADQPTRSSSGCPHVCPLFFLCFSPPDPHSVRMGRR